MNAGPASAVARTRWLVIGYGNTLRGDDAAGPLVAERVAAWRAPGVETLAVPQLTPELAAAVARAGAVLFVDATVGAPAVTLREVLPDPDNSRLEHAASPATLLALTRKAFGQSPPAWLLTIPAERFEFGAALTPLAARGVEAAVAIAAERLQVQLETAGKGGEPASARITAIAIPPPNAARRAVIDVGTNSVKLLVADVAGDRVVPVSEHSRQTRLGRGFYAAHVLQPEPIAETVRAIARFATQATQAGAARVRIVATSAAREARNAADLRAAVRTATGQELEIIPGDLEARWGFAGVMSDPRLAGRTVLLLDAGGGSTEFILGRGREVRHQGSYPLGIVRLFEDLRLAEPPRPDDLARGQQAVKHFLVTQVAPQLEPILANLRGEDVQFVGTGGTATVLAAMALRLERFDREALDGFTLTRCQVAERLEQLWSLPLARRRQLPGLPPERADVILTGTLIYDTVMGTFGFDRLRVTTRGLRFAAVMEPAH